MTHTHTNKSDPSVPETQDLQNCDIENLRLSSWAGPNVKVISWVQYPIDSYPFCSILLGPELGITFAEIHSHIIDHREFQFISRSFHINRAIYSWYMARRRPIHYVLIHGVQTNRPEFKIYIFFINHLHKFFDNIFNHQMDLGGFGENAERTLLCTQTVSQTDRQPEKHTAHKMKPVYPFNFVRAEGLIKLIF